MVPEMSEVSLTSHPGSDLSLFSLSFDAGHSDPESELQSSSLFARGDSRHTYPSALIPGQPDQPPHSLSVTFKR